MSYLWGYLINGADIEPQLDFWHKLVLDMADNTLDENEEASRVKGRRIISRTGTSRGRELVTATRHCRKRLEEEKKWRRVKQTYQKQLCANPSGDSEILHGGIAIALNYPPLVLCVMQRMLLMLTPKNEIST